MSNGLRTIWQLSSSSWPLSSSTRWAAAVLPALWCALSGATLLAIEADAPWLPPLGAALAFVLGVAGGRRT